MVLQASEHRVLRTLPLLCSVIQSSHIVTHCANVSRSNELGTSAPFPSTRYKRFLFLFSQRIGTCSTRSRTSHSKQASSDDLRKTFTLHGPRSFPAPTFTGQTSNYSTISQVSPRHPEGSRCHCCSKHQHHSTVASWRGFSVAKQYAWPMHQSTSTASTSCSPPPPPLLAPHLDQARGWYACSCCLQVERQAQRNQWEGGKAGARAQHEESNLGGSASWWDDGEIGD